MVENLERNQQKGADQDQFIQNRYCYSKENGYEKQYTDPNFCGGRVYDYYDNQTGTNIEVKSGRLDPQQLEIDEQAVKEGHSIQYHVTKGTPNSDLARLQERKARYLGFSISQ